MLGHQLFMQLLHFPPDVRCRLRRGLSQFCGWCCLRLLAPGIRRGRRSRLLVLSRMRSWFRRWFRRWWWRSRSWRPSPDRCRRWRMGGVQRDHIFVVIGRRWRRCCYRCWRLVLDHLWCDSLMMLNRLLAEPRQMGPKIARRQRVDNFDGVRRWPRFRAEQTWQHDKDYKEENSMTQRRND